MEHKTEDQKKDAQINPIAAGLVGAVAGAAVVALTNPDTRRKVGEHIGRIKDQTRETLKKMQDDTQEYTDTMKDDLKNHTKKVLGDSQNLKKYV